MMTHRRSSPVPRSESSVAWYKIIAISFLVLTIILLGLILYITTKHAAITVIAKEDSEAVNLMVKIASVAGENTIGGNVSTTAFYWSKGGYTPGATESAEGTAQGKVILYNKTASEQKLIKTTRLLTASGVLFRLSSSVAIPAQGQLEADVYADKPGKESDIMPSHFTIPGLPPALQQDVYAESTQAMTGGSHQVGVVTQEDIDAAKQDFKEKTISAFLSKMGTNSSADRIVLATVLEDKALADQKPGAKVSQFTVSGTSTLAVVTYNPNELHQLLTQVIGQKIDMTTEKILSVDSSPVIKLSSTNVVNGTAELSVTQNIVATLKEDVSNTKLNDKNNYLGKTKDEIDQYVRTLPHVSSSEISFSPAWFVHTAPRIPDKISITIRTIK